MTAWFQSSPDGTHDMLGVLTVDAPPNQLVISVTRADWVTAAVELTEEDEAALLDALTRLRDWRRARVRAEQEAELRELLAEHDRVVRRLAELYDGPPNYAP